MQRAKLWLGAAVLGIALAGCDSPMIRDLLDELGGSGSGDGSPDAGGSGSIATCEALAFSTDVRLAPAAPGQRYVRCGTLGPEVDWRAIPSPDASALAARTPAGTVRLLQTSPWREVAQLASPLGQLDAVAFSPDGARLATLSAEMGEVSLWQTRDGALAASFVGPPASTIDAFASALAFSSDGARLATSLGTVIDLATGTATDWRSGAPVSVELAANPENLDTGEAIPLLAFSAAGTRLFVETQYQIGNSPPSVRLALVEPGSGQSTVLFEMYTRALAGYALSADRRLVALGRMPESQVSGLPPGLYVYDADTGALLTSDPTATAQVLGFSPDGQALYVRDGDTVTTLDAASLQTVSYFPLPAGTVFLGVAPDGPTGRIVGTVAGATTWWHPVSGASVASMPVALSAVSWSADGRYGVATGDPGTLFQLWRESGGQLLCAPPPSGSPAPALADLGVTLDSEGTAVSSDGATIATDENVVHTHATDWSAVHVRDVATGTELRVFGATPVRRDIALREPAADQLYTRQGADVAVWCR